MFLPPSRLVLQEHLGYERFVLDECVKITNASYGTVSATEVVIHDATPHNVTIAVQDYLGTGAALEIVQHASPLLFSAAFKLLDMVIEWIIFENRGRCPWKFHEKKRIINTNTPPLQFPDYFQTDRHLRNVLIALYATLSDHRNAITHGDWGSNHDGELRFDFVVLFNNLHVQQVVSFQQVLDFAAWSAQVGDTLVNPALQSPSRVNILRWLSDRILPLHNRPQFNTPKPNICKVRRKTTWNSVAPVEIDLVAIRKQLTNMHPGTNTTFDLLVEATTPTGTVNWSIPEESVPPGNGLTLDVNWNHFKATIPAAPVAPSNPPVLAAPSNQPEPSWTNVLTPSRNWLALVALLTGMLIGFIIANFVRQIR